jgi:hypothetical protein
MGDLVTFRERAKGWVLREYKAEQEEIKHIAKLQRAYSTGDLNRFVKEAKRAKNLIRRRERRFTFRLIVYAKRAKITVFGNTIDVFEKELLEMHNRLYHLLDEFSHEETISKIDTPEKVQTAIDIEDKILERVRALTLEIGKSNSKARAA